jgi:hypothetical protein
MLPPLLSSIVSVVDEDTGLSTELVPNYFRLTEPLAHATFSISRRSCSRWLSRELLFGFVRRRLFFNDERRIALVVSQQIERAPHYWSLIYWL